jgi:hypothetical protein
LVQSALRAEPGPNPRSQLIKPLHQLYEFIRNLGAWIGVDAPGRYVKVLDSDSPAYGGSGYSDQTEMLTVEGGAHGRPFAIRVKLPPLGGLVMRRV